VSELVALLAFLISGCHLTGASDGSLVDSRHGFVLGRSDRGCPQPLLSTRDGGRSFTPRTSAPAESQGIAFSSARDGWAFGPGLYRTRDGAASWQSVVAPAAVVSLDARGPTVIAILRRGVLISSTAGGRSWRRRTMPGRGSESVHLFDRHSGFALHGHTLWLTRDGGRRWQHRRQPCGGAMPRGPYLGGTSARNLWLVCGYEPGAGQQEKVLYRSDDGGLRWHRDAVEPPSSGYLNEVVVVDRERAYLAPNRHTLQATSDGGRHWRDAIAADRGDTGDLGIADVEFADPRHGWALAGLGDVFRTSDGGRHWLETRLRP
jgi:photosystem II stability/assembly factor-like uncharacterized protein